MSNNQRQRHESDILREWRTAEIERIGREVSKRLFAQPMGGKNLSEPEFLRYCLDKWPDLGFRQYLRKAQGDKAFVAIVGKLMALSEEMIATGEPFPESWLPPPMPEPMQPEQPLMGSEMQQPMGPEMEPEMGAPVGAGMPVGPGMGEPMPAGGMMPND